MDRDFWENVGLFQKRHLNRDEIVDAHNVKGFCVPLQMFCSNCKLNTTWRFSGREDVTSKELPLSMLVVHSHQENNTFASKIMYYRYQCAGCSQSTKEFIIHFKAMRDNLLVTYQKIGQWPPFSIDPPKEFEQWDEELQDCYKKGKACENNGLGIAAFAYYRRIVERTIDGMLNDVALFFESQEAKDKYIEELAKAEAEQEMNDLKHTINAQKKIALVRDMLPQILRPGGVDPLGVLHNALSIGIHDETEDFCLKMAGEIRTTLAALMRRLAIVKDDDAAYRLAIQTLLDNVHEKAKAKKSKEQAKAKSLGSQPPT